jgi:hypothetical protein
MAAKRFGKMYKNETIFLATQTIAKQRKKEYDCRVQRTGVNDLCTKAKKKKRFSHKLILNGIPFDRQF